MTLETTLAAIAPADEQAMAAARDLQARLTKPAGSLGELEERLETALRAVGRSRTQLWRGSGSRPASGATVPPGRSGTGMDLID